MESLANLLENLDVNGGDGGESDEDGEAAEDLEVAWDEHKEEVDGSDWKDIEDCVKIPLKYGKAGLVNLIGNRRVNPSSVKLAEVPCDWIPPSLKEDEPKSSIINTPDG